MGQTTSTPSASTPAPAPMARPTSHPTSGTPPAECPMHASNTSTSKYVPTDDTPVASSSSSSKAAAAAAVVNQPAQCPIQHDDNNGALNPLNQMPNLSHDRAPNQRIDLPTTRTASTIPRPPPASSSSNPIPSSSATTTGPYMDPSNPYNTSPHRDDTKVWEYPSPQQFYNALVRKGWETPEEHVETMVEIHNFLNEQAWEEVLDWEKTQRGGSQSRLAKFQGHPGKRSPKARIHLMLGSVFPSKFNTEPPFDRHDWVVHRPVPSDPTGPATEIRYVIDYYSAPPDEDGNPVFYLDVRPALDSVGAWGMRMGGMFSGLFGR